MCRDKSSSEEVRGALKALYPRLWRYCRAITGTNAGADDLAQAACLRAIDKAAQYQPGTQVDRWVFKIAQSCWLNDLRAAKVRRGGGLIASDEIDIPDTHADTESNILARQVLREVGRLPEAQRAAVLLAYVEGYRYKEVAEILDIPIGTVMSRLAAARATLASRLGENADSGRG